MTPFDFWADMWRSGTALAQTGYKLAEMARASGEVIEKRSRMIADAGRDPLNGDYVELGRMVPEKVAAFSQAGMAAFGDVHAIQMEAVKGWTQMMQIAFSGRPPSASQVEQMTARTARVGKRAAAASGKALAPVHRSATGNARRLKRSKPR